MNDSFRRWARNHGGVYSVSAGGGGGCQVSGTDVMPVFFGDGAVFSESGFRQLSGTKVMPDFGRAGAGFPATGGTRVRPWHAGHGIWVPECCSSHPMRCPQCEQLNLIWLIKFSLLTRGIIGGNVGIVQLLFPCPRPNNHLPGQALLDGAGWHSLSKNETVLDNHTHCRRFGSPGVSRKKVLRRLERAAFMAAK
jgi:hypothetical protein